MSSQEDNVDGEESPMRVEDSKSPINESAEMSDKDKESDYEEMEQEEDDGFDETSRTSPPKLAAEQEEEEDYGEMETTEQNDEVSDNEKDRNDFEDNTRESLDDKRSEDGDGDKPKESNENAEPETELVSEDEFPTEGVKQLDTEAVSDEELQELLNDDLETEAVSDDELPPVQKKRKHRRRSESDDDGSSSDKKKRHRKRSQEDEKRSRSKTRKDKKRDKSSKSSSRSRSSREPSPRKKSPKPTRTSTDSKPKVLPELPKYWKAVKDDPSDFTGWTYLLQYVDQENDAEAAREAYDAFLRIYPYCYGYWRKYADYEKHKGDKNKCEEVFARGLKAIPLSVDLWLHYLNFCKTAYKDNEEALRGEFEKAINKCGLEFRSDRLWDCYIKWETELKNYQNVFTIYDRLLNTPVLGFKTHFENFEDFVKTHQPNRILSVDEFLELRSEVVQKIKEKGVTADPSAAAPPGDESVEEEPSAAQVDEETALMREKIIASRKKIFKNTTAEVTKRWKFEEGIKRPYFHVKPLEKAQLNSWQDYIDFEISIGDSQRIVILFERCLIACALYKEFWIQYVRYLQSVGGNAAAVRNVYQRACLIHHVKDPYLAYDWAAFEESEGDLDGARKVLNLIEKQVPNMMLTFTHRINLERRAVNFEGAAKLFEYYLKNNSRNQTVYCGLSTKYSRFAQLVLDDTNKSIEILKKAIKKYPDDLTLYMGLLDLYIGQAKSVDDCVTVFNQILERESFDQKTKMMFAQRKIEYLEDTCNSIKVITKAQLDYIALLKKFEESNKAARDSKTGSDDGRSKSKTDANSVTASQTPTVGATSYTGYNNAYQSGQGYPANSTQYSASYTAPQSAQYGTTDQNSSNYQNWNYSQSNYNSSNQSWGGYNYYS